MPARLRSLLTLGLSDLLAAVHARVAAMDEGVAALRTDAAGARQTADVRLAKIEEDIVALRALVRARDDRAQQKLKAGLSSLANLLSILPHLRIDGVVPPFPHQGFEITGEEAAFVFHLIRRHRPRLVLELGSGSSTVLLGAAVRANGGGRVVTVEHDLAHARQTTQLLEQADLSGWVEIVHAPLVELSAGGRNSQWYDLNRFLASLAERIDFLFVDGPPGKMQSLSRYPALPLLLPHLSPQALIFVDDGGREDETRMIEMWRDLDVASFVAEPLGFLPRAPVLLTLTAGDGRIAELRVARGERAEPPVAEEEDMFGQARRSGTS